MKNNKIQTMAVIGACVTFGICIGWSLHLFTESKIPFSYRTDDIVLDTLAALGIRNYNP